MHNYSVDNNNDKIILTIIIILAGLFDALLNYIFSLWISNSFASFYYIFVYLITFASTFAILFFLFNNYFWKKTPFNKIVKCPDLNGKWEGQIINPDYCPIEVHVEIKQTWTKIIINLRTKTAESATEALSFFTENSMDHPQVKYIYYNKTKNNLGKDFYSHGGTALLTYNENCLGGNYYTDEQRKTYGQIKIYKKDK